MRQAPPFVPKLRYKHLQTTKPMFFIVLPSFTPNFLFTTNKRPSAPILPMQLPGDANATTPGHALVPAAAPHCRQPPGRRAAGHGAA